MAAPRAASRRPTSPETSEVRYRQIRKVSLNLILCKFLDVQFIVGRPGHDHHQLAVCAGHGVHGAELPQDDQRVELLPVPAQQELLAVKLQPLRGHPAADQR